jgi:hypothetical protein
MVFDWPNVGVALAYLVTGKPFISFFPFTSSFGYVVFDEIRPLSSSVYSVHAKLIDSVRMR